MRSSSARIARPLRSILPTISPTSPRATPSGLTRTRVRSLSDTVGQPTEALALPVECDEIPLGEAPVRGISSHSTGGGRAPEAEVVDPDAGEEQADDVHGPGDGTRRDDPRLQQAGEHQAMPSPQRR